MKIRQLDLIFLFLIFFVFVFNGYDKLLYFNSNDEVSEKHSDNYEEEIVEIECSTYEPVAADIELEIKDDVNDFRFKNDTNDDVIITLSSGETAKELVLVEPSVDDIGIGFEDTNFKVENGIQYYDCGSYYQVLDTDGLHNLYKYDCMTHSRGYLITHRSDGNLVIVESVSGGINQYTNYSVSRPPIAQFSELQIGNFKIYPSCDGSKLMIRNKYSGKQEKVLAEIGY